MMKAIGTKTALDGGTAHGRRSTEPGPVRSRARPAMLGGGGERQAHACPLVGEILEMDFPAQMLGAFPHDIHAEVSCFAPGPGGAPGRGAAPPPPRAFC